MRRFPCYKVWDRPPTKNVIIENPPHLQVQARGSDVSRGRGKNGHMLRWGKLEATAPLPLLLWAGVKVKLNKNELGDKFRQ